MDSPPVEQVPDVRFPVPGLESLFQRVQQAAVFLVHAAHLRRKQGAETRHTVSAGAHPDVS